MANLFTDTFQRVDNATTLGPNWTNLTGAYGIASNQAISENSGINLAVVTGFSVPSADYSVTADVGCAFLQNSGIVIRETSANTYYYLRILQGTGFQLFKIIAGATTQLASLTMIINSGQVYTITLECIGNIINGYINSFKKITVSDTAITAKGNAGLRLVGGNNTGFANNFYINQIALGDRLPVSGRVRASGRIARNGRISTSKREISTYGYNALIQDNGGYIVQDNGYLILL